MLGFDIYSAYAITIAGRNVSRDSIKVSTGLVDGRPLSNSEKDESYIKHQVHYLSLFN